MLFAILAGMCLPVSGFSVHADPITSEVSELPWSTVSAVLKKVVDIRPYSYAELVDWYQVGLVTVVQSGSGYQVSITDADGLTEVLVIENI